MGYGTSKHWIPAFAGMTAVKLLFILYRHSGGSRNPENGKSI